MTNPIRSERHRTVRRVQTTDVGVDGFLGAGFLLDWIESAAHDTACRWSGGVSVLASVGTFHMDHPVWVGDTVELDADLVYTGTSSMHILITVRAGRPNHGQTAQCPMVFVALDGYGRPTSVAYWTPDTMLDLQRHRQARFRAVTRKRIENTIAAADYRGSDTPRATMRFRAGRADVDRYGAVRAGRILRWIDVVAASGATAWAGRDAAIGYLAGIRFTEPIVVGDAVDVTARIIHTGPRSMHCAITCRSADGEPRLLTAGLAVLVSLDENGNTRPVPQWQPEYPSDRRLDQLACDLIALREFIEPFTTITDHRRGA